MGSKSNGTDMSDWVRGPPTGTTWQRLGRSIYNPEEKSLFGRTAKRWGIVITFYSVFYAVLALLFALCMGGLFLSLDESRPTYTLDYSLIGSNPGVACRPRGKFGAVTYSRLNASEYESYVQELQEFFEPYAKDDWYTEKKVCVAEDNYGFPETPCFFIKLNKIIDWKPDYYNDPSTMPEDAPTDLVDFISDQSADKRNQVWISCWQEKDNTTTIEYPWGRGLPGRFYPYRNEESYRSPLIAVKLVPRANTEVIVRCRVWAKNIIYNKSLKDPSGYTRLPLYIEDITSSNSTDEQT